MLDLCQLRKHNISQLHLIFLTKLSCQAGYTSLNIGPTDDTLKWLLLIIEILKLKITLILDFFFNGVYDRLFLL
jgi:hypothetical protein